MVRKLSEQVASAEDTIHLEVDVVQRNIDQYVAFANKKFAAENDFVKYQLAGTVCVRCSVLYCCTAIMYDIR